MNISPENNVPTSNKVDFDLGLLIVIAKKTIVWAVFIMLLSIGTAYAIIHYTEPVYESNSVVQIISDNQANRLLNVDDIYEADDISKDIEIMRSREFFKRVVAALPLDVSYYHEGEVLKNERFKNSPYEVGFEVDDPIVFDRPIYIDFEDETHGTLTLQSSKESFDFVVGDTVDIGLAKIIVNDLFLKSFLDADNDEDLYYFTLNSPYANLKKLYGKYTVQILSGSAKTVRITVKENNASKATAICDKIAQEFIEYDKERRSESAKQVLEFIDEQLEDVYGRLRDSETLIKDFKKENRLSENSDFAVTYINRLEVLETDLAKVEVQLLLLQQLKRNIDEEKTGIDINSLMPVLAGSDFEEKVELQIMKLQELVMKRNNQLTSATRENPTILIYDQRIESQKTLILRSLDALEDKLQSIIRNTNSKIREIDQNFTDLPSKEIEYARLSRVYNSNEKYYTLLLEKKTEYSISKAGFVSENTILQRASNSNTPISPRKNLIYTAAFAFALFIIIAVIAVRYLVNNEISGPQDLGRLVLPQISMLGVVPKYSKDIPLSQLIVDKKPKSVMAEAFRSIRSNLEFFELTDEKKVIAVTSTISGEGKTFVAINLGGILAFSGKKVIILDLDMRKPRIHKGFNSTNEYGMSTYLSNRDDLDTIVRKSELEGLHFVTAGPVPPNPSELIINGMLTKALTKLKST